MPTRPKRFHTPCQEEVYRQVKAYLDELVDEHFDDAGHCDFYLKYGTTVLEISIQPFEDDDAVVEILAFCVQGGSAAEEQRPQKNSAMPAQPQQPAVDARQTLRDISGAIPVYAGARYRDDLTRRDQVMIRNQYGADAQVYTLATDDSYPQ